MNEVYWPAKNAGSPVPHILGLTASPLMRSNLNDLELLERTLDAVCRSPNRHREELIAHANRPEMLTVPYGLLNPPPRPRDFTASMASVDETYRKLDIAQDPEIIRLKADKSNRGRERLRNAVVHRDTYIQKQMKAFLNRSQEAYRNIGPWAADYYIHRVVSEYLRSESTESAGGGVVAPTLAAQGSSDDERQYLANIFEGITHSSSSLDVLGLEVCTVEKYHVLFC